MEDQTFRLEQPKRLADRLATDGKGLREILLYQSLSGLVHTPRDGHPQLVCHSSGQAGVGGEINQRQIRPFPPFWGHYTTFPAPTDPLGDCGLDPECRGDYGIRPGPVSFLI